MSGQNSVLAKMAVIIGAQTTEFNRALAQSDARLKKFTTGVTNAANAMGLALGATAVYSGLKYGVTVIADFEKRMSEVKAITGATGKEFQELKQNALDLGKSTRYTSEQVAELQVAYGRLGFTNKEILQVTESTLDLATATGEDLAKSADIAGSTLRGFGLEASEMQRVIDVMASSFNKSALGLENFYEAIKYVAPVAAANNISLEETTALLGTLADNGIRGSMAGTSLRKIISDLDKGTKPLNEKLADLAAKGFNSAEAMDEVGRTAYASLLTLVKYTNKTDDLTEALKRANGEATKQAEIMEDNLVGDYTKLTSAIDGLILSFEKGAQPMRDTVQALTELVNLLSTDTGKSIINSTFENMTMFLPVLYRYLKDVNDELKKNPAIGEEYVDKFFKDQLALMNAIGQNVKPSKAWNPFGDLFDKIGQGASTATDQLKITIEALEKKRDELNTQFEQTDITDKKKLTNIGNEIKAINDQIAKLEELRKKQQEVNTGKFQFIYDAEAEGSTNPELRNEQAINEQKEFAAALNETTAALNNTGDAMIKLDAYSANFTKTTSDMKTMLLDFTPVLHNAFSSIGQALGQALTGTSSFGDAILKTLGGVLTQLGEMLITAGLGVESFKVSLKSLNGYAAIAAGVALVALGASISSSIKGLGSTGGSSYASTATYNSNRSQSGSLGPDGREIKVSVEGVIEGDNIRWILNRNTQLNNRTR